MRVTFYSVVVLVAAGSVVLGLDWMSAPMPPMPPMPEAKNVVFVPPPPPPAPRAVTPVATPSVPVSVAAPAGQPSPQSASANPGAAPAASSPAVQAPTVNQAPAVNEAPAPVAAAPRIKCDIDVCAAAYRSFRESDCTYNPSFGPRRLCTKGDPEKYARDHPQTAVPAAPIAPAAAPAPAPALPPVAQTAEPGSIMAPEPGTSGATPATPPRCNVSACAAAYPRSFRESDCTFNPSSGPRKLCER